MDSPRPSDVAPSRASLPWDGLLSRRIRAEPLERAGRLSRVRFADDAIDLASQQPSEDLIPHEELRVSIENVLRKRGAGCLGYASGEGVPELRASIASDLADAGVAASPDEIVVTSGSQQGIDLLVRALVDPGDPFLVESATYPGTIRLLAVAGARVLEVPTDRDGPDMAALRRLGAGRPKGLYLMPGFHNPTGATIAAGRRREILDWSHDAEVALVEDDYDAALDLDGEASPARLRALDPEVCHVGTYSKKLIPALRVGYLLCPAPIRDRVVALKTDQDNGTSALLQHALADFIDRGCLRAHVRRSVVEYRRRRDTLHDALRAELPDDATWTKPGRGLFIWIALPERLSAEAVHAHAARLGVRVLPSPLFRPSTDGTAGIRVVFCRESPDRLVEGARRLGAAMRAAATIRRRASDAASPTS